MLSYFIIYVYRNITINNILLLFWLKFGFGYKNFYQPSYSFSMYIVLYIFLQIKVELFLI